MDEHTLDEFEWQVLEQAKVGRRANLASLGCWCRAEPESRTRRGEGEAGRGPRRR